MGRRLRITIHALVRDAEPVLVRDEVGGRDGLLGDEVHRQVHAEPQVPEQLRA
jgi:hypothetical protein